MTAPSTGRLIPPLTFALLLACTADSDAPLVGLQPMSFANSEWSEPVHLDAPVNSRCQDQTPTMSKDELSLYFLSDRPGGFGTLVSTTGGDGYCWGANTNGQLGNGTTTPSPTPTPIAGGLGFATVSAFGSWHSCGLSSAGVAYCWGYNGWGQVGDGTTFDAHAPGRVLGQTPGSGTGGAPLRASRVQRRTARAATPVPSASPRALRP